MGCEVTQCCCGCSLKTGSMVIGIIEAIGCGLGLIGLIMAAASFGVLKNAPINDPDATDEQIEEFRAAMAALVIIVSVIAVLVAVEMIFSILLACGASHEKPGLVKPWIIYSIVSLVLGIILNIVLASVSIGNGQTATGLQMLASCALSSALKVYFIIVVRSFHLELTRPGAIKTFA